MKPKTFAEIIESLQTMKDSNISFANQLGNISLDVSIDENERHLAWNMATFLDVRSIQLQNAIDAIGALALKTSGEPFDKIIDALRKS